MIESDSSKQFHLHGTKWTDERENTSEEGRSRCEEAIQTSFPVNTLGLPAQFELILFQLLVEGFVASYFNGFLDIHEGLHQIHSN